MARLFKTAITSEGVVNARGLTLSSTTSPLTLNATVGTAGQVLSSAGAGTTPSWRDGPVNATTSTGATGFGFMGHPQQVTTTLLQVMLVSTFTLLPPEQ
jgi:hypothetical protein